MDKAIIDVFAEVIAGRDGYAPHETLPAYYTEAREILVELNKRGLDLARIHNDA